MKPTGIRSRSTMTALILLVTLALSSHAAGSGDHDRARQALEAGEILPLKTVLATIGRDVAGQVMEVELERKHDRWIYEIKLLRPGGALVKLLVNASDGTIIDYRGRGAKADRRGE